MTEAQEQVFQALAYGNPISAPAPWLAQVYPDDAHAIFGYLQAIYENLIPAHRVLAGAVA
jgi:hypothetical protein